MLIDGSLLHFVSLVEPSLEKIEFTTLVSIKVDIFFLVFFKTVCDLQEIGVIKEEFVITLSNLIFEGFNWDELPIFIVEVIRERGRVVFVQPNMK